jgi:mRNA-degrading endonuclease YafQ of YafQ-DinJ toxin-antitoxin module
MQIIFNNTFERQYRKLNPILKRKVDIAIEKFEVNPYDISLMNHNLTGKLVGYKSIRVNYNVRIIFTEEGGYTLVHMIQIGTHDEVYR